MCKYTFLDMIFPDIRVILSLNSGYYEIYLAIIIIILISFPAFGPSIAITLLY